MMEDRVKPVYIEKLFESKNPKLARWIPGFVYSFLKRVICQDQINDFISKYGDRKGLDFSDGILEYLDISFQVEGAENLPDPDGRYIFASNHPLGGPDGIIFISFLGQKYPNLKFPVNDLLMNLHGLAPLCIPINKTGSQSRDFPKMVEAGFASDNHIIMFPAGLCSRRQGGEIKDLEWKKTFVTKSIETHRDVVPLHFEGRNSDFFYNLANICKALGIKFNIAMLYLADEMLKNRHKTFTLTIGKPIPWQTFDKTKTPAQWAQFVKDVVYKL